MTIFILNKILTGFILLGGFAGYFTSPLGQCIYWAWVLIAGAWAGLNLAALIDSMRGNLVKKHLKAIKISNMKLYHAQRAITLTLVAILCFVLENQFGMALLYSMTVLPYALIMYRMIKVLEQKRQKIYNN